MARAAKPCMVLVTEIRPPSPPARSLAPAQARRLGSVEYCILALGAPRSSALDHPERVRQGIERDIQLFESACPTTADGRPRAWGQTLGLAFGLARPQLADVLHATAPAPLVLVGVRLGALAVVDFLVDAPAETIRRRVRHVALVGASPTWCPWPRTVLSKERRLDPRCTLSTIRFEDDPLAMPFLSWDSRFMETVITTHHRADYLELMALWLKHIAFIS